MEIYLYGVCVISIYTLVTIYRRLGKLSDIYSSKLDNMQELIKVTLDESIIYVKCIKELSTVTDNLIKNAKIDRNRIAQLEEWMCD